MLRRRRVAARAAHVDLLVQLREERLGVHRRAAGAHEAGAADAIVATLRASAGVRPSSGFGGFTFTKSAPRHRATPAAPAMRPDPSRP